jgi:hypothetical protein
MTQNELFRRFAILALVSIALPSQAAQSDNPVTPFSAAPPGAQLPKGWIALRFGSNKQPTEYRLVQDGAQVVLHARAVAATGGLLHPVNLDVRGAPLLRWRWKISQVIADADNAVAAKEDSPARIVLGFDGDLSRLTAKDRTASALAKSATGRALPYAQLMYIWSTKAPVGSVIQHPHSQRVRMVVAASGSANAGKWVTLSRNVYADFKRAFGEEPGALTDVGVLTDSDNTGASVEAWYGDIRFAPATR